MCRTLACRRTESAARLILRRERWGVRWFVSVGYAQDYTELVCGMNLELMNGLVDGLERSALEPLLDPAPDRCCVRLRKATPAGGG
jgi:hypothetical protein